MSNSQYNLDETPESFEFTLGGNQYRMRYPNTEEIEEAQNKFSAAETEEAKNKEVQNWMYGFVSPVTDGAPSLEEALKKVNVKVLQRFSAMLKTEMGLEA